MLSIGLLTSLKAQTLQEIMVHINFKFNTHIHFPDKKNNPSELHVAPPLTPEELDLCDDNNMLRLTRYANVYFKSNTYWSLILQVFKNTGVLYGIGKQCAKVIVQSTSQHRCSHRYSNWCLHSWIVSRTDCACCTQPTLRKKTTWLKGY